MIYRLNKEFFFRVFVRWFGGLVILGMIGFGGWWFYRERVTEKPETLTLETLTVSKGIIEDKLTGERGIVELQGQITLKSPTNGTVETIFVTLGDRVGNGQSLLVLKDTQKESKNLEYQYKLQTQQINVQQKREQLKRAQINLEEAKLNLERQKQRGETSEQVELQKKQWEIEQKQISLRQQQKKVAQAKQDLKTVQEKLTTDEKLFAKGYIPEDQLQDQRRNVINAQTNLENTNLELKQGNLELAQLQLNLQILRENIAKKLTENQENIRQSQKQITEAENNLKQAESDLSLAILELEKTEKEFLNLNKIDENNLIIAPSEGKILDLIVKKGDVVKLGDDLLTLGDPNQQIIQLQLSILNAPKIKPSQLANVSMIGPNAQNFTGKIESVSLLAKKDSNSASGQLSVGAIIKLEQSTDVLIPGSPVNVEIILQQKKDVLILPLGAIQNEGEENFVWVKDLSGKARKKTVTLGLESLNEVEIISGLQEGDQVLLPSSEQLLEAGMLVD